MDTKEFNDWLKELEPEDDKDYPLGNINYIFVNSDNTVTE